MYYKPISGGYFPPINFVDVFTLKAYGELRRLFANHWSVSMVQANCTVTCFCIVLGLFLNNLLFQQYKKDTHAHLQESERKYLASIIFYALLLI